jgi:antitoxin component YwqK of YwqJK toxin-antitoxin module
MGYCRLSIAPLAQNIVSLPMRFLYILALAASLSVSAKVYAQPHYTPKYFVTQNNPNEFVAALPKKNGTMKTYLSAHVSLWDIDDDSTTYIQFATDALLFVEGPVKNGKRNGIFITYLIDSANHNKRYKIYEQTYLSDKLEGQWRVYTLKGRLTSFSTYKADSLHGLERQYWIDGKSIVEEHDYIDGKRKWIKRTYNELDKPEYEITYDNSKTSAITREYYPDGVLKQEVRLKEGFPNGVSKDYYTNGKLKLEQEMKNGQHWTVIASYGPTGVKRDAGTLKDGNGTIINYKEDGSVQSVVSYKDGVEEMKK